jgi:hypothetical protein
VGLALDPREPWVAVARPAATPQQVSSELYGRDVSSIMPDVAGVEGSPRRFVLLTELLLPDWRNAFDRAMNALLDVDVAEAKGILLENWIGEDEQAALIRLVERWTSRRDLRAADGQSYLDVFLRRLQRDRWTRDYGLWTSDPRPFLDLLFESVGDRVGQLTALVAENSLAFGAYRPVWAALDPQGRPLPAGATFTVNAMLVRQVSQLVRDRLEDYTSAADSHVIADALVALPAPELSAVLRDIMSHYTDTDVTGVLGRYGEAWEGGMLYYLFEDLTEGDRKRVAEAMKDTAVLPVATVDALVAGRGLAGELLPWSTHKGEEAASFWADVSTQSGSAPAAAGSAFMGGMASLWLPSTAFSTVGALASAGAANPETGAMAVIAEAAPLAGQAITVGATFVTSFNVTIAVQNVVTDTDVWSGRPLGPGERLASGLQAGSGVLLLGASFAAAAEAAPTTTPRGPGLRLVWSAPRTVEPSVGGASRATQIVTVRGVSGNVALQAVAPAPEPVPTPPSPLRAVPDLPAGMAAPAAPSPAPTAAGAAVAGGISTAAAPAPAKQTKTDDRTKVPSGKLVQDRRDHIPIVWFKPLAAYPSPIELIDSSGQRRAYSMTQPGQQVEPGRDIGVWPAFLPAVGKSVQMAYVLQDEDRGPAVDRFRSLLERHGWLGGTDQIDHVQDLQWEGRDDPQNLWPLDATLNQDAGRNFQNYRVTYSNVPGGGPATPETTNRRLGAGMQDPGPSNLVGRWFVIREIRL